MTGKEWTTPLQKKFLQEELVQYMTMTCKQLYKQTLFPDFYKWWSEHWPKRASKFLEIPLDTPLTDEQATNIAKVVGERKKVSRVTLTPKMNS